MHEKLRILYLPHPPRLRQPWLSDLQEALGSRHELRIYDPGAPLEPQLDVDIVVDQGGGQSTREMARLARSVKLWQILATGVDDFDLDYWHERGIAVANTPGQFSAVGLAECALMFMLMLAHRWHDAQIDMQRAAFYGTTGQELEGSKLLLLGFGSSARALASRALPFGFRLSTIEVREVSEAERREFHLNFVGKPDDLDRLLPDCDYLSLHLHLSRETRHIIDSRRLSLMKPSARLINVARGALVDEAALYRALAEGELAGAGLDVFESEPVNLANPLLRLPNVVSTPHIAGATAATSRRRARCVAENIDRLARGLEPLYRVDFSM
jgi:phosphoglycerate dehydrogenase-like enzyme